MGLGFLDSHVPIEARRYRPIYMTERVLSAASPNHVGRRSFQDIRGLQTLRTPGTLKHPLYLVDRALPYFPHGNAMDVIEGFDSGLAIVVALSWICASVTSDLERTQGQGERK